MAKVAALYVMVDGPYVGLEGVDAWTKQRDARQYSGPWPVVAHPPCARWSRLAGLVESRWGKKRGEDGGCFEAALRAVRTYGGVLEHPADTDAWIKFRLPVPMRHGGWQRGLCGGWSCQVVQRNYGHRARKMTWLYAFGVNPPPRLAWGNGPEPEVWVSCDRRRVNGKSPVVERMGKRERLCTPLPFRDLLLSIAQQVEV